MSGTRKFAKIALGLALGVSAVLSIGCKTGPQHVSKASVRTGSDEATGAARAAAPAAALSSVTVTWPQHDPTLPEPHLVFGEPIYADDDSAHNIVRQYGAFTVYYDDQVLAPRWTAIKVTREMADANCDFRRPGSFKTDSVLTSAGLQTTAAFPATQGRRRGW